MSGALPVYDSLGVCSNLAIACPLLRTGNRHSCKGELAQFSERRQEPSECDLRRTDNSDSNTHITYMIMLKSGCEPECSDSC